MIFQQKLFQKCFIGTMCLVSGLFLVFSNIHQSESMRWLFLQIFGTDCVIVEDWVDKTGSPPPVQILKTKALSNVFSLFLRPALSHPGGGVRRLLSSYCSARQNYSSTNTKHKYKIKNTKWEIQNTNTRRCQNAFMYHLMALLAKTILQNSPENFREH